MTNDKTESEQFEEIIDIFRKDIAFFAKCVFDITLHPKQVEIVNAFRDHKRISVKGGVGFGKTLSMAVLTWWALITHEEVSVTIYGPNDTQLKYGLWREIMRWHEKMAEPFRDLFEITATKAERKINPKDCFAHYKLSNPENPASSRGAHILHNFVLVDEATGIDDIIYEEAIINVMSDKGAKICLVSNPTTTSGFFWRTFNDPQISHMWHPITVKASDRPSLTEEELDDLIAGYGGTTSNVYRSHILGEFPITSFSGLIARDWLTACVDNEYIVENPTMPYIWGVDVGGGGEDGDRSVIVVRNDRMITNIIEIHDLDPVQLGHRLYELYRGTTPNKRPIAICVDGMGVGSGTVGILKELDLPYRDVRVGSQSTTGKDRFYGLRDQLWWAARDFFEHSDARIPNHPDLINELALPTYNQDRQKIKVEDKKSLRKRYKGKSTDFADALCLTFAVSKRQSTAPLSKRRQRPQYNYAAYE